VKIFRRELTARATDPAKRRWLYVPYDQLSSAIGPLAREAPWELGIVLIESPQKAARRPYHRQKLALILANQRQFALEQAARGVAVRYLVSPGNYKDALEAISAEYASLRMMEPAERELRVELAPLVAARAIEVLPHEGWLSTRADFIDAVGVRAPWRMDAFYRRVRARSGFLMDADGKPEGGKFSFDAENRQAWPGTPAAPDPPNFTPDAVTAEVGAMIESRFARHPGVLDLTALPATAQDAEHQWHWALRECLRHFGPFEDAMSTRSSGLFHTRISALLNVHRLLPARVVADVATSALPLASREGFVRQVLGWREFVRHVHVETDGFRQSSGATVAVAEQIGDGGYARWSGEPWSTAEDTPGGARPSALGASEPIPAAFWGTPSGLHCLDTVVADVWREGYGHHITRLMVLANFGTLLGLDPRELTDWFWVAYADAYDWVVEPNVLGMGTFATGEMMTTKPYVSGAAYIDRMSDYCGHCEFEPGKTCPVTRLYWAFLDRSSGTLARNPRTAGPVSNAKKRSESERLEDQRVLAVMRDALGRGQRLTPASLRKGSAPR
jgi:deoxyribodipyrimidine photolyase-related protein